MISEGTITTKIPYAGYLQTDVIAEFIPTTAQKFQEVFPRIIDDAIFEQAQILLEKNKKAPARAKAIDGNYLLTKKLFCGHCKATVVGVSGTSRNGTFHQYYQCVTNRRHDGCKKKTIKKAYIEDWVITETRRILTLEYIDKIARSIEELCEKERNT